MNFFNLFSSRKTTQGRSQKPEAQLQSTLFDDLNQTQKFAMFTMLASLAAAPACAERTAIAKKMVFADAEMIGITQNMMLKYMLTHKKASPDDVIATLKTITDTDVLEWLIYCGYGITAVNQSDKAISVFLDWWQQLGYKPDEIERIVKKVESTCNQFNNL